MNILEIPCMKKENFGIFDCKFLIQKSEFCIIFTFLRVIIFLNNLNLLNISIMNIQ